ncbi:twin-arginine translocase subunit TatC [Fimbriimonas ginsengisoli]|uniref:Sec-independent protein translocase protein TatC n=1 Tax=Fimbriimonas ginsengisoli Gsoil 348 TaxID=661478 RepID=A0A068NP58_FIMGI|nr:twin-arginine translocase subunit TatC [Fimbriimonas ginsengisoli]AIE85343.1 twin arginine-targeting protein translocase TatC [Fimbriimonas ginsengisoli Gsoil 348]
MAVLFKGTGKERRPPPEDPEEYRLTLVEHLEELRDRLIRSIFILGIAWFIGWQFEPFLYSFLSDRMNEAVRPVLPPGVEFKEVVHNAADAFMLKVKLSFFIGLVPAFPFVVLQLWGFIEPALKPAERKPVRRVAPYSLGLFAMGATFAWFILPSAMRWFASYLEEFKGVSLYQEAGTLAFFVLKMMLAFGIAFQLPLVVFILGAVGLLKADTLMQYWRQAATAIFVLSMIVTPSNDPATMLMMAIPLVILFVISVYAVKVTEKRKLRRQLADELSDDHFE